MMRTLVTIALIGMLGMGAWGCDTAVPGGLINPIFGAAHPIDGQWSLTHTNWPTPETLIFTEGKVTSFLTNGVNPNQVTGATVAVVNGRAVSWSFSWRRTDPPSYPGGGTLTHIGSTTFSGTVQTDGSIGGTITSTRTENAGEPLTDSVGFIMRRM